MLRKVVRYDAKRKATVEEYVDLGPSNATVAHGRLTGSHIGGGAIPNRPIATRRKGGA